MTSLIKEMLFLVLQFLEEAKFKEALHVLEKESGLFFNMKYFEDCVINGELEEADKYLSGFTKVEENRYSLKMFFEIRKQRYLEALDKHDHVKAVEILRKDLILFDKQNERLFKEITHLLTMQNFRENAQLSEYVDAKTSRAVLMAELKRLIKENPRFRDKLQFPAIKCSRLRTLVNQSLNWQHLTCKNPKLNPEMKTLFSDHTCGQSSPITNSLVEFVPKVGSSQIDSHGLFRPTQSPVASLSRSPGSSSLPHQSGAGGALSLGLPSNAVSTLKRPRSARKKISAMDCQPAGRDQIFKRMRPFRISKEGHVHSAYSSDDLPKNVVVNLSQSSAVKSMDFHPSQQTLLLVGTNIGDVAIWEVSTRERLIHQNFKVWDMDSCSTTLLDALSDEYTASVNRVIWSPDGTLFGVAYSKHIIHLYSYRGGNDLHNHLEIDAHIGNVSDIAFSTPTKHLYVVTCGEDTSVKVWDAATGSKLYTFEGHEAAVYSVCPHYRGDLKFIFSTDIDGKIKAWLYDNEGAKVHYDAPGCSYVTMAYSADGTRLFSCGTNKNGEPYLLEWDERKGTIKRSYSGLGNQAIGVVQFDTTKNKFLAVGDEFMVKIWDMDEENVIKTIDADGGLPASPCIRFNKEGTLLAISTSDKGVKILANAQGPWTTCAVETRALDPSRIASSSIPKDGGCQYSEKSSKIWKVTKINEASRIHSFRLPDNLLVWRVVRLTYTNSGSSILALQCNAVHKLWKWQKNEKNLTGKATTAVLPHLWQPARGISMVNDRSKTRAEEAVHCFALSENDSHVVSASGGRISLFNMMDFKKTILSPRPAATCLAFDPTDDNVIAIGMEDASILIYQLQVPEVKKRFKGHQKRVTGLAFSSVWGILVSSGADAQVCVWSRDDWKRRANKFLRPPHGRVPIPHSHTHVQFHQNQTHFLVVLENQIAIYEALPLDCIKQWVPRQSSVAITDATYSCDGQSIYASLDDGSVHVFAAGRLQPKCQIKATAYLDSPSRTRVYPVVIASHPSEPNQFALGLSDGGVHVLEPLEAQGKWGDASRPAEESSPASTSRG